MCKPLLYTHTIYYIHNAEGSEKKNYDGAVCWSCEGKVVWRCGGGIAAYGEKLLWFCSEQVGIPAMITLSVVAAAESITFEPFAGSPLRSAWRKTRDVHKVHALCIAAAAAVAAEEKGKLINYSSSSEIYVYIYMRIHFCAARTDDRIYRHAAGVLHVMRTGVGAA